MGDKKGNGNIESEVSEGKESVGRTDGREARKMGEGANIYGNEVKRLFRAWVAVRCAGNFVVNEVKTTHFEGKNLANTTGIFPEQFWGFFRPRGVGDPRTTKK